MSQFFVASSGGSPIIPPDVPTQFDTENGTAVPEDNVIDFEGGSSVSNKVSGITTVGGTPADNIVTIVLTNRFRSFAFTTGPQQVALYTVDLNTIVGAGGARTYAFEMKIAALNTSVPAGAAFSLFFGVRSDGVNAVLCNSVDMIANKETALNGVAIQVDLSATVMTVAVTGVNYLGNDLFINWTIYGEYLPATV